MERKVFRESPDLIKLAKAVIVENTSGKPVIVNICDPVTGNCVNVTPEGEIKISSFANIDYKSVNKNITTTEKLASVGVSNLAGRKELNIFNKGAQTIFYGPTGVTDVTGTPIEKDEVASFDNHGDNINIFLVTKTGTATVIIEELS